MESLAGWWTGQETSLTCVWDEDIHVANADGDGLGDALESALGTSTMNSDSDADGLPDHVEVIGIDDGPLLKYPLYGADPLQRDVFVEADWRECIGCPGGPDSYRLRPPEVERVRDLWLADYKVHVDIATANTDPVSAHLWNDWGGASRQSSNAGMCSGFTERRQYYRMFHHALMIPTSGQGQTPGRCLTSEPSGKTVAHELGHNFGLLHGGTTASGDVNCKPHYRSLMNYAFLRSGVSVPFSRGTNQLVISPESVNEVVGWGTTDPTVLDELRASPWSFSQTFPSGASDINRDGTIETSARGTPAYSWGSGGCDPGTAHPNKQLFSGNGPSIGRFNGRLYVMATNAAGKLEYRSTSSIANPACPANDTACPAATWTPPAGTPASIIDSSSSAGGQVAMVPMTTPRGQELLLVYRSPSGTLLAHRWLAGSLPESAITVPSASSIIGSVSGVLVGGTARIFAIRTNQLSRWDFNPTTGTWAGPFDAQWSDGSNIFAAHGIGLAQGYLASVPALSTFAAIPAHSPAGQVDVARLDPATMRWIRFPTTGTVALWLGNPAPRTSSAPGLAYVPFRRSSSVSVGRFFLLYTDAQLGSVQLRMSQGNDPNTATVRGMWFHWNTFFGNFWLGTMPNGVAMFADPAVDDNPRAAVDYSGDDTVTFYPFADGVFSVSLRDTNDYAVINDCMSRADCP